MKFDDCTCTYYQLKQRGLMPDNHNKSCPLYRNEVNKYSEEWLRENDKIKYCENQKSYGKKQEIRYKKTRKTG